MPSTSALLRAARSGSSVERRAASMYDPREVPPSLRRAIGPSISAREASKADRRRAVGADAVAVLVVDVDDRAEAPAVLRRVAALVDAHVLDGVGVEGREDAEEVRRVVDGRAVEQDQRLVGRSAADVEARREIARRLDAGQALEAAEDVGFEHGRQLPDGLGREFGDAHPPDLFAPRGLAGHRHLREFFALGAERQVEAERLPRREGRLARGRRVADVGDGEPDGARRQRQRIKAARVGDRPRLRAGDRDAGAEERLAGVGVAHVPGDGGALRGGGRNGGSGADGEKGERGGENAHGQGGGVCRPPYAPAGARLTRPRRSALFRRFLACGVWVGRGYTCQVSPT